MRELLFLWSMNREILRPICGRATAAAGRRDRSSREVTLLPERDRISVLPLIPGVHNDQGLNRRNTPTPARLSGASAPHSPMEQLHFVTIDAGTESKKRKKEVVRRARLGWSRNSDRRDLLDA